MQCIKEFLIRLCALLRRDVSAKVVFYHDIGKVYTPMGTPENVFWSHMKLLREGDVVCFDDGFRGIWDVRERLHRGILDARKSVKVMVFVAIDLVGRPGYLTWEEIKVLQNDFGLDFQCHTLSHQTLAGPWNDEVPAPKNGRTDGWYQRELVDSKAELEQRLGKKISSLCLPVGYFSDDAIRRCKEVGYEKVYVSYPGNITNDYIQPRCLVQDLSIGTFKAVLNGGMNSLQYRYLKRHKF